MLWDSGFIFPIHWRARGACAHTRNARALSSLATSDHPYGKWNKAVRGSQRTWVLFQAVLSAVQP